MRTITHEEKEKLKKLIEEGVKILAEINDLKTGLADTVKTFANDLDIKAAVINKAIKAAYKVDILKQKEALSDVEELLEITGNG